MSDQCSGWELLGKESAEIDYWKKGGHLSGIYKGEPS